MSLTNHFLFQHKWASGLILNVGCDGDPSHFSMSGAVNLDVNQIHPTLGYDTKAHVIHDIRQPLPENLQGGFDTVVFGDVIEHMTREDALLSLRNIKTALKPGGRVVITCPHDYREMTEDVGGAPVLEWYTEGVSGHHRPITPVELSDILSDAGLKVSVWKPIDYGFFRGSGVVCEVA